MNLVQKVVYPFLLLLSSIMFASTPSITVRIMNTAKLSEKMLSVVEHEEIKKKYADVGLLKNEQGHEQVKELFKTRFLKNSRQVASYVQNPPLPHAHCKAEKREIICDAAYTASIYYFDRKSDVLIVAAPGFGFGKEVMALFAEMFPSYDLLLLEHRGHGLLASPQTMIDRSAQKFFGVVPSLITWGNKEIDDLEKVVTMTKQVRHKKVLGLAFCYSSLIFTHAQKKYPLLFTHMALDGTILSLVETFERIGKEKGLLAQVFGDTSSIMSMHAIESIVASSMIALIKAAKPVNLRNDLGFAALRVPTLVWWGKQDGLVPVSDFETLWNKLSVKYKMAVMTNNRHLVNHLKEKELYRWSVEQLLMQ